MIEIVLIGIGTGNPEHLTRAGERALRASDLVLIPRKGPGKADLADLREAMCRSIMGAEADDRIAHFDMPQRDPSGPYTTGVQDWHDAVARAWQSALGGHPGARSIALLIWGDPSLYDSALRIAARLSPKPVVRVIPGITALQALTAAHAIPLNDLAAPVLITTGRNLRDNGWPDGVDRIAVMLDGACSFQSLAPDGLHIWWGAFLGMPEEILIEGAVAETRAKIIDVRARARSDHGWIMDTYLIARS